MWFGKTIYRCGGVDRTHIGVKARGILFRRVVLACLVFGVENAGTAASLADYWVSRDSMSAKWIVQERFFFQGHEGNEGSRTKSKRGTAGKEARRPFTFALYHCHYSLILPIWEQESGCFKNGCRWGEEKKRSVNVLLSTRRIGVPRS